jgi:hypothetical protein
LRTMKRMRVLSFRFCLFIMAALALVFWLPLRIPMHPSGSISFELGFNNRAALVGFLAVLALGCFSTRGLNMEPTAGDAVSEPDSQTLLWGLLATAVCCAVMAWVAHFTWGMDESPYLIGRVRTLLLGQRPYQDFEFIYGPLLLYMPAWVARAFHIDAGPAYFIAWTIQWLAGTAMIALAVRWLGFAARRGRLAFWLIWSAFLSSLVNTGETYTPFRELAALVCLLAVHRLVISPRRWRAFAVAVLSAAAIFTISPEMATAFMAATALYLGLASLGPDLWWSDLRYVAGYLLMLLGFLAVLVTANRLHEFDSAKAFGSGGADVPLLLTPTSFFVLAAMFVSGVFAASRLRELRLRDPRVAATIVAFSLLPGAFGRADPSHLVLYGLSALMVALSIASAGSAETWLRTAWLFVLLCSAPLLLLKLNIDRLSFYDSTVKMLFPQGTVDPGSLGGRVHAAVLRRLGPSAERKLMRRAQRAKPDPHVAYPLASTVLQAPFGYSVRGGLNPVIRSDVVLGYFDGLNDVMSLPQVGLKTSEIAAHPERDLLLPVGFDPATSCVESPEDGMRLLSYNYGYNYLRRVRNIPRILDPLCEYIGANYIRIAEPPNEMSLYDLWRRKPHADSRD